MADKFNLIFLAATTLTVLCGIGVVVLAIYGPSPETPQVAALFETLKALFTAGALAIFGLLGARANSPRKH